MSVQYMFQKYKAHPHDADRKVIMKFKEGEDNYALMARFKKCALGQGFEPVWVDKVIDACVENDEKTREIISLVLDPAVKDT